MQSHHSQCAVITHEEFTDPTHQCKFEPYSMIIFSGGNILWRYGCRFNWMHLPVTFSSEVVKLSGRNQETNKIFHCKSLCQMGICMVHWLLCCNMSNLSWSRIWSASQTPRSLFCIYNTSLGALIHVELWTLLHLLSNCQQYPYEHI